MAKVLADVNLQGVTWLLRGGEKTLPPHRLEGKHGAMELAGPGAGIPGRPAVKVARGEKYWLLLHLALHAPARALFSNQNAKLHA